MTTFLIAHAPATTGQAGAPPAPSAEPRPSTGAGLLAPDPADRAALAEVPTHLLIDGTWRPAPPMPRTA